MDGINDKMAVAEEPLSPKTVSEAQESYVVVVLIVGCPCSSIVERRTCLVLCGNKVWQEGRMFIAQSGTVLSLRPVSHEINGFHARKWSAVH